MRCWTRVGTWPAVVLAFAGGAAGQTAAPATVADLRPPAAPAFVLLSIEPAAVTNPSSPRALSAWAMSNITESRGIPQNLAIEVSPFWMQSRPAFEFDDYFANSVTAAAVPGILRTTILRSLALSAASAPAVSGNDTTGTALGFGIRTLLWPGRAPRRLVQQRDTLAARLGRCAAETDPAACYARTLPLRDSIRAGLREPEGFVFQVAGGASLQSSTEEPRRTDWRRWGVWASPAYRTAARVDFIGVLRFIREAESGAAADADVFDAGLRLLWRPTERFAVSAEGLNRWSSGDSEERRSRRWGGLVEFRARDDLFLFYALGKDFAAADATASPLFARLGRSVGVGQKPSVIVP